MRSPLQSLSLAALLVGSPTIADAQALPALAGVWQRVSQRDSAGATVQPPNPPAFAIYTASGYYAQIAIPTGRPKVQKPLADMTKDELLAILQRSSAYRGTYTTSGNRLTRKILSDINPLMEGTDLVQLYRISGDTLTLSAVNPASKAEARFVRVP